MYRKSILTLRKEAKRKADCEKMRRWRDAKERKRLERAQECGEWTYRDIVLRAAFSPDGREVGLRFADDTWSRCGSERFVRGQLAKKIWGMSRQV